MSYLKYDPEAKKAYTETDGDKLIQAQAGAVNPNLNEIAGTNDRLRQALMENPNADVSSLLDTMSAKEDTLSGTQQDLLHLSDHYSFDSSVGQESLQKMVDFKRKRDALAAAADSAVRDNPILLQKLKDGILSGGTGLINYTMKGLGFFNAREAGLAMGLINSLKGQGTVLDSMMGVLAAGPMGYGSGDTALNAQKAAVNNFQGFGDVLKAAGVPQGPHFKVPLPTVAPFTPSSVVADMLKNVKEGRMPIELRPFGPTLSVRGAVGLGLDIALDPLTYLTFGENVPEKVAEKIGYKSVLSFAGKTLLKDTELARGLDVLKSTNFGKAVLKSVDDFSASQLGTMMRNIGDQAAKSFLPDYKMHKPTMDILEKAARATNVQIDTGVKLVDAEISKLGTTEEQLQFATEMFDRNRKESIFRRLKTRAEGRILKLDSVAKEAGFNDASHAFETIRNLPERLKGHPFLAALRSESFRNKITPEVLDTISKPGLIDRASLKGFTEREIGLLQKYKNTTRSLQNPRAFEQTLLDVSKLPKSAYDRLSSIKFNPRQPLGLGKFSNPKFQEIAENLIGKDGLITNAAREAGLPDHILHENYIPGIVEEASRRTLGVGKKGPIGRLTSGGALRRNFKITPTNAKYAYATRLAELIKVGNTRKAILQVVKNFGADENTFKAALRQGYDEFFPRDVAKAFGMKSLEEKIAVGAGEHVYLPKEVMDTMLEMGKRNDYKDLGPTMKAIDGYTRWFKAYVTSIWPSFHARNLFSNQVLRYINEGVRAFNVGTNLDALHVLIDSPQGLARKIELGKGSKEFATLKDVSKWAKEDGIQNTNMFANDIGGKYLDSLNDRELGRNISSLLTPNATKNDIIKIGREIGGFIEDHGKLASYIQALKDGFSREEARSIAYQSLFDYSHLTSFEKTYMRRLIPFYTFNRKNIGAQLHALLTTPGRQANVMKIIKDIRDDNLSSLTPEQLKAFNEISPRLAKESFAIPTGVDHEGNPTFFTGFGLPQEQALQMINRNIPFLPDVQNLEFQFNPVLKTGIINPALRALSDAKVISFKENYTFNEMNLLYNHFFKTDASKKQFTDWINDPNGFPQWSLGKLMGLKAVSKDVIKDGHPTGEKEYSFEANPVALDLLRSSILARHLSLLKQISDPNADETQQMVRFLSGAMIYKQALERSIGSETHSIKDNIAQIEQEAGVGYRFSRQGTPKSAPFSIKRFNKEVNRK